MGQGTIEGRAKRDGRLAGDWPFKCFLVGMSKITSELVLNELKELRVLESKLSRKWTRVKRAGRRAGGSLVQALLELDLRAQRLERLLDNAELLENGLRV
jgi:hypothetical protein